MAKVQGRVDLLLTDLTLYIEGCLLVPSRLSIPLCLLKEPFLLQILYQKLIPRCNVKLLVVILVDLPILRRNKAKALSTERLILSNAKLLSKFEGMLLTPLHLFFFLLPQPFLIDCLLPGYSFSLCLLFFFFIFPITI